MNTVTNTDGEAALDNPVSQTDVEDPAPESGEVETAEMKRHRTSPRTKAFDEALAVIDGYTKGWADDADLAVKDALVASFQHCHEKIAELRDNGAPKPTYGGRHYVRVFVDGKREAFQANNTPTKRNQGEKVTSVLGPFRTKDGAGYAVAHEDHQTKIVF